MHREPVRVVLDRRPVPQRHGDSGGSPSTPRRRERSAPAQPWMTPAAATSSGMPASVIESMAATLAAISAALNSSQPITW